MGAPLSRTIEEPRGRLEASTLILQSMANTAGPVPVASVTKAYVVFSRIPDRPGIVLRISVRALTAKISPFIHSNPRLPRVSLHTETHCFRRRYIAITAYQ